MHGLFLLAKRQSLFFNVINKICRTEDNIITMGYLVATPIQAVGLHEFPPPKNF